MSQPLLTLCMIFRDEAKHLAKCLKSVAAIVDEMVLIDTGSADGSDEIARSFGARVIHDPWQNDFSYHRNKALDLAQGQWILALDADEIWKGPGRKGILKLLSRQDVVAYQGPIHEFFTEDGREFQKSVRVRIWRNQPEIRYERRIHEQLIGIPYNASVVVFEPTILVHHFGYTPREMERKKRAERNIRLLEQEAAGPTADPFTFFNLGTAYASAQRFREAIPHLEKAKTLTPPDLVWVPTIYKNLANCQLNLGWYREAFQVLWSGTKQFPFIPDYWYYLGYLYRQFGMYRDSARAYHRCVTMSPPKDERYHWEPVLKEITAKELPIVLEQIKTAPAYRPLISLCMMVRDEAKHLEGCLRSAMGVVEEIIVVDTGSRDETVDIAKGFGAKVFFEPWIDHFAKTRNASLDKATGRWILILDADDELSAEAREQIPRLAREGVADGYALYTVNHMGMIKNLSSLGHFSGRLFRNRPDLYYAGAIHEQIAGPVSPYIETLPYVIYHHGYLYDAERDQKRVRRNKNILLRELSLRPNHSYFQYEAGLEFYKQENYPQAALHFQAAHEYMQPESAINPDIYQRLALCYRFMQQKDDAWKWLEDGMKAYPDFVDIFLTAAHWHYADDNYPAALRMLGKCLALGQPRKPYPQLDGSGTYRAHNLAGHVHERLGNWEKALQHYYLSLNLNGAYGVSFLRLLLLAGRYLSKSNFQRKLTEWFRWEEQQTGFVLLNMLNRCHRYNTVIDLAERLEAAAATSPVENLPAVNNVIHFWKAFALLGKGLGQEARVILAELLVEEQNTDRSLWGLSGVLSGALTPSLAILRLMMAMAEGRFEPIPETENPASVRLLRVWRWICSVLNDHVESQDLDWTDEKETSVMLTLTGLIAQGGFTAQASALTGRIPDDPHLLNNAFWYFTTCQLEPFAEALYRRLVTTAPDHLNGFVPYWRLQKAPGKSLLQLLEHRNASGPESPHFYAQMAEVHLRLGLQVQRSLPFPRDGEKSDGKDLQKVLSLVHKANRSWLAQCGEYEHIVFREGWIFEQ